MSWTNFDREGDRVGKATQRVPLPQRLLLHGALALSLAALMPLAAHAVEAAASDASAADTSASDSNLGEIVVTAERRNEKLVDVPIVVTALSDDKLQSSGVTDMNSLAQAVPGLHVDQSGAFFQPSIRGIGTAISGAGASANVATYIDGVYKPNALLTNFEFIDVDSIQVLKGPQGTLFGRNTTGGAILVQTLGPTFDTRLDVRAGFGTFDTANGAVFASTGLTDTLAASVAIGYSHSNGWVTNIVNDLSANRSEDYTGRVKFLFKPNDQWKALLTFDVEEVNDPSAYAATAWNGYSDAHYFFGVPISEGDPRKVALGSDGVHIALGKGIALKVDGDLGFATLTSISSAHWDAGRENTDESASPTPANGTLPVQPCPTLLTCEYAGTGAYDYLDNAGWRYTEKSYSQEIDLGHSGSGPLDWVTGLYYFWDDTAYDPFNVGLYGPFGPGGALTGALPPWPSSAFVLVPGQEDFKFGAGDQSGAVFADATVHLGDLTDALQNFHFTAGGRYDKDKATVFFHQYPIIASGFVTIPTTSASTDFDSFTPRAVLRYTPTADSSAYVSWSKGTKAGLYNGSGYGTQKTPLQPEKLTDIEGGYKLATPNFSFEASAYHYDYKELQVAAYVGCCAIFENAPEAKIYGGELDWKQKVAGQLRVDVGLAYTHARYTNFPNAELQTYNPLKGVIDGSTNVSGGQMERTPTWTGSIGPHYDFPLAEGNFNIDANYSFQTYSTFDFAGTEREGGYGLVNLRLSWVDPSKHWTFALIGKNLTDKAYLVQILPNAGGFGAIYGEPTNVTAEVYYKY
jgi:iron complex outermembrane receptor protein